MYLASKHRYHTLQYRCCGCSGFRLPVISLGIWHNFGGILCVDLEPYRDDLIISTKAGWDEGPG